jgi:hypothetical protein
VDDLLDPLGRIRGQCLQIGDGDVAVEHDREQSVAVAEDGMQAGRRAVGGSGDGLEGDRAEPVAGYQRGGGFDGPLPNRWAPTGVGPGLADRLVQPGS